MALSSSTVWEIRATGNAANGGGFRLGAPGTDYSQQDAPQLTVTDAAATGTTTLTSTTGGFTAAMVGNILQITGGTLTAGFYEITAFTDTNTVTLDRSPGSGSGSTVRVGGALTLSTASLAAVVAGNTVWVRNGNYTLANATLTPPSAGTPPASIAIKGYNTVRGDLDAVNNFTNYPAITKTAGTEAIWTLSGNGTKLFNFVLDGGGLATHGVNATGNAVSVRNCRAAGCTVFGFLGNSAGSPITFLRCRATAQNTGGGFSLTGSQARGCRADGNPGIGFTTAASGLIVDSVADGNASHGISAGSTTHLRGNVCHNNSVDGIRLTAAAAAMSLIENNILSSNGGYGLNYTGGGAVSEAPNCAHNAYFNNTSGERSNIPAGGGDVTLTANPFVNAAAGDFSLNNTAGGGMACRAAGTPGVIAGGTTIGYRDIGAAQHADPPPGGQLRIFGSGVIVPGGVL
jgi:parallel beta-helix repeat protein